MATLPPWVPVASKPVIVVGVSPRSSLASTLPVVTATPGLVAAASLTASGARSMAMVAVAVLETASPSLTVTCTSRLAGAGVSLEFAKRICWSASA